MLIYYKLFIFYCILMIALTLITIKLYMNPTLKMEVSNEICFGDITDLLRGNEVEETQKGDTIIYRRDTCRQFVPGTYNIHKIKDNIIIFSIESVDPVKIHNYLLTTDVGEDFRAQNYINRYDWMNYRNFQDDFSLAHEFRKKINDLFDHCFITPNKEFYKGEIDIVEKEKNVYAVFDRQSRAVVSYICDIDRKGEWNYGALLLDEATDKYFAFIFQDEYTLRDIYHDNSGQGYFKFDGVVSIENFYY